MLSSSFSYCTTHILETMYTYGGETPLPSLPQDNLRLARKTVALSGTRALDQSPPDWTLP